ncbi:MAG: hypothetical protein Q8T09_04415 [Candidatus Melainabacteria bacterium]|nr:hypothetical protein [Candidatus Melainabacteria bacterium]
MLMADTLAIFLVVLGFLLALPGLWLLCSGLWPTTVSRSTFDCNSGLLFPFLVGVPISLVAFFATVFASKELGPASGFVSIAIVCFYVLFASVGIAGLTTVIGNRLPSPVDIERPWKATIRGSIVLELAFLLPLLGWFVLLPAALIIGSGTAFRSILKGLRMPKSAQSKVVAETAESHLAKEALGSNPEVA